MAYKALQIAQLLLSKAAEGNQELMSNLKLQKMLYYEQGFHLAAFDTPLFDENIEAWMFGPVVPEVYENMQNTMQRELNLLPKLTSS